MRRVGEYVTSGLQGARIGHCREISVQHTLAFAMVMHQRLGKSARARERERVCVCVCVKERERESEREIEREIEREKERERVFVCICVYTHMPHNLI